MILYTPMQLELVLEGFEEMQAPRTRVVSIENIRVLVEETNAGEMKINRILSTDPNVFLRQEFNPGNAVYFCQQL